MVACQHLQKKHSPTFPQQCHQWTHCSQHNLPVPKESVQGLLLYIFACDCQATSIAAVLCLQPTHGNTCTAFGEPHLQHFAQLLVGESAFVFHIHQVEGKCNTIFYSASVEGKHSPYKGFVADKPRFLCSRLLKTTGFAESLVTIRFDDAASHGTLTHARHGRGRQIPGSKEANNLSAKSSPFTFKAAEAFNNQSHLHYDMTVVYMYRWWHCCRHAF